MHAALTAARRGEDVLLLCRRDKLEQSPPVLPEGVAISDPAWQRVNIKFVANGGELLRYVSLVHALPRGAPDLLLVDDLHALADLPVTERHRPRDMALCRIAAALHEAVVVASKLKGRPCQLIVTEASHAEGPRQLYILQRWLPLVLHIRPVGQAQALAIISPRPGMPASCMAQVRFSLRHGVLVLEGLQPGLHW